MNYAQTHTQVIPSDTWTITHPFTNVPITDVVTTVEGTVFKILPLSVKATDETTLTITFSAPIAGIARLYGNAIVSVQGANSIDLPIVYPAPPSQTEPASWSLSSGLVSQENVYSGVGDTLSAIVGTVSQNLQSFWDTSIYNPPNAANNAVLFVFPEPTFVNTLDVTVFRDSQSSVIVYWDGLGNRVDGGLQDGGTGFVTVAADTDKITWNPAATITAFSIIGFFGYPQGVPFTINEIAVTN